MNDVRNKADKWFFEKLNDYVRTNGVLPSRIQFADSLQLTIAMFDRFMKKRFGNWNEFIIKSGYKPPKRFIVNDKDKQEMIEQFVQFESEYGYEPQLRSFRAKDGYKWTKQIILKTFGTWNGYRKACGKTECNRGSMSIFRDDKKLLSELKETCLRLDTTDSNVVCDHLLGSKYLYQLRFGNWQAAITKCGLKHMLCKTVGNRTKAEDGHMCDSMGEAIVDNWLYHNNIDHDVHVSYPGKNRCTCDFVANGYWIEFTEAKLNSSITTSYTDRLNRKIKIAKHFHLNIVIIDRREHIDIVLRDLFLKKDGHQEEIPGCKLSEFKEG